jgi:soluble lytic murein transglycosylase
MLRDSSVMLLKKTKKHLVISTISFFVVFFLYCLYYFFSSAETSRYDLLIIQKSKKYNLSPNLVKAVIWKESKFDANAVGKKGEIGLMQIMQKAAVKDWENYYKITLGGKGILFNPSLNIEIGCWYLAKCRRHWRKYREPEVLMMAEYNAGYRNVKKWLKKVKLSDVRLVKQIEFRSTKKYVKDIMRQFKKYDLENNLMGE